VPQKLARGGRAGRASPARPIELDVNDLPLPDGMRLASFSGAPEISVWQRKLVMGNPRDVEIYWAAKTRSR